tara:strand:+ start:28 stop:414 length:387 start_codon:yes stop_codon:yes gene_type:complete
MNNIIYKKIIKVLVDQMIPASNTYKMPRASNTINIDLFYNQIRNNQKVINEIDTMIKKNNFKVNTNFNKFFNEIFLNRNLQNFISEPLLDHYFTSATIDKILKKKGNTIPFGSKKDQIEEINLLKKVK